MDHALTFRTKIKSSGYGGGHPAPVMFQPRTMGAKPKSTGSVLLGRKPAPPKEFPMSSVFETAGLVCTKKILPPSQGSGLTCLSLTSDGSQSSCMLSNRTICLLRYPLREADVGRVSTDGSGILTSVHWASDGQVRG